MIKTDYTDLVFKLLPPNRRKPRRVDLNAAHLAPLISINQQFISKANEVINYRSSNNQSLYLRDYLNDIFDPDLRRIWLETLDESLPEDPSLNVYFHDDIIYEKEVVSQLINKMIFAGLGWSLVRLPILIGGLFDEYGTSWLVTSNTGNAGISFLEEELTISHAANGVVTIENLYTELRPLTSYKITMVVRSNENNTVVGVSVTDGVNAISTVTIDNIASSTSIIKKGISSELSPSRLEIISVLQSGSPSVMKLNRVIVEREPYLFFKNFKNDIVGLEFHDPNGNHTAEYDPDKKALKFSSSSVDVNTSYISVSGLSLIDSKSYDLYMTIGDSSHANVKVGLGFSISDGSMGEQNLKGTYVQRGKTAYDPATQLGIRFQTSAIGDIYIYELAIVQND